MSPPKHLDADGRAKWREVLPILEERGDVDQGVLDALAAYCSAWARWIEAEGKAAELGPVVKSPAGFPVENPYLRVAAAAQRQLRQWGAELKLTPKAKGGTPSGKTAPNEPDPLTKLLQRRLAKSIATN